MRACRGRVSVALVVLLIAQITSLAVVSSARAETPAGQVTWAVPVSLPPAWFDPAEATGLLIPFVIFYALHDGLAKPMPGDPMAPYEDVRLKGR